MGEKLSFCIHEEVHTVAVRRIPQARRLTLRVDPAKQIRLTVPPHCSERRMRLFINQHAEWLQQQIAKTPASIVYAPGGAVPLRGEPYIVAHVPGLRGPTRAENGRLVVGGDLRHLQRRLRDFLKKEAKREFAECIERYTRKLGVKVNRIGIRDTRSRWGSCSGDGALNFSWRLIMAPPFVLDYVCAHEVAHLRHMNHGKEFWALVGKICPRMQEARIWLRANGSALLAASL